MTNGIENGSTDTFGRRSYQAYLIFFGTMVNGVTSFGSKPTTRGQFNQVANSAQTTLTAMIAGPTNR
jgi:hypothetical protein